jgi:hypothetical protein
MDFFFSYFTKNQRKQSRTPHTSFLMFNVNNNNYATMPKSFPSQYLQKVDFKFFP